MRKHSNSVLTSSILWKKPTLQEEQCIFQSYENMTELMVSKLLSMSLPDNFSPLISKINDLKDSHCPKILNPLEIAPHGTSGSAIDLLLDAQSRVMKESKVEPNLKELLTKLAGEYGNFINGTGAYASKNFSKLSKEEKDSLFPLVKMVGPHCGERLVSLKVVKKWVGADDEGVIKGVYGADKKGMNHVILHDGLVFKMDKQSFTSEVVEGYKIPFNIAREAYANELYRSFSPSAAAPTTFLKLTLPPASRIRPSEVSAKQAEESIFLQVALKVTGQMVEDYINQHPDSQFKVENYYPLTLASFSIKPFDAKTANAMFNRVIGNTGYITFIDNDVCGNYHPIENTTTLNDFLFLMPQANDCYSEQFVKFVKENIFSLFFKWVYKILEYEEKINKLVKSGLITQDELIRFDLKINLAQGELIKVFKTICFIAENISEKVTPSFLFSNIYPREAEAYRKTMQKKEKNLNEMYLTMIKTPVESSNEMSFTDTDLQEQRISTLGSELMRLFRDKQNEIMKIIKLLNDSDSQLVLKIISHPTVNCLDSYLKDGVAHLSALQQPLPKLCDTHENHSIRIRQFLHLSRESIHQTVSPVTYKPTFNRPSK